jgi:four helix bundle protein
MSGNPERIQSHRDLIAWQRAMDLVVAVYQVSKAYPKEELYGLTSQTRRAAASIPANIAEGQGRRSKGEFRQFLGNARGSLLELDTHLELAARLGFLAETERRHLLSQLNEVARLVNGLLRALSTDL